MGTNDPISDMLTRLRNAIRAKKEIVRFPSSRLKEGILKICQETGYIKDFREVEEEQKKYIEVGLKYVNNRNVIYGITRISKPGRRDFVKCKEIPYIYNGLGIAILSTSKGIISDHQARKLNIGGEHLCNIW